MFETIISGSLIVIKAFAILLGVEIFIYIMTSE
ncbi:MAG: hypothetical protein Ta2D_05380 [Rickettsiales bacterium]|nr:MAG: hypothetical protein Ta2D_05380 [Rickettsiales bacterium]